jgi:hypothetical protein
MPLSARDVIVAQQLLGQAEPETTAVDARVLTGRSWGLCGPRAGATISAMTP